MRPLNIAIVVGLIVSLTLATVLQKRYRLSRLRFAIVFAVSYAVIVGVYFSLRS